MPTIEIVSVGDNADLSALKRNFGNLLQRTFNPKPKPMTFSEAIVARGIDQKHQIRLLHRRARYHQQQDRPKVFANAKVTDLYVGYWTRGTCYTPDVASHDLATMKHTTDTAAYVSAWCRLNHLKEV